MAVEFNRGNALLFSERIGKENRKKAERNRKGLKMGKDEEKKNVLRAILGKEKNASSYYKK